MNSNEITRSIYYYEWYTHSRSKDTDEVIRDKSSDKIVDFLNEIKEKQASANNYKDFMVKTSNGDEFIIVDDYDENQIKFRLVLSRENALPYIEENGKLEGLNTFLELNQNIAEVTHCVFFCKFGILGSEYNYNGARATSVVEYMLKRNNDDLMPRCRVKLNYDSYSKLIKNETLTLFDFSVVTNSRAYNEVLANKSIFSAIQSTVPESDTMEVVIKKRKTKKNNRVGFWSPISFDEIKDLLTNYREDLRKFNISQSEMGKAIDLLTDKFVGKTTIIKTPDRMIDSNEMYESIANYFEKSVKRYC
jgi:hypothetical protein